MPSERRVFHLRVDCADSLAGEIASHAEPVAAVAVLADPLPLVALRAVVERDCIRIGDKWRGIFMLDLNGSSWKDKAIVLRGPGVAKAGIRAVATKRADTNQRGFVDHGIAE